MAVRPLSLAPFGPVLHLSSAVRSKCLCSSAVCLERGMKSGIAWGCLQAADAAADMLSQLDAAAAERNDKVDLFHNAERFPGVAERRAALGACKAALAELLPLLARRLRVPRLEYKSIMNQGDYLIEVDVDRTDIPKARQRYPLLWRPHPAS